GPQAVRDGAAGAAGPARVFAGGPYRAADAAAGSDAAGLVAGGGRGGGGAGVVRAGAVARLRDRRMHRAGGADRRRGRRRLAADGSRTGRASGRCGRWRTQRAARAGDLRADHAVLLAVRPEGLDLGDPGWRDDDAVLVPAGADAGAEPVAGDAADPVQQPGAVPAVA